MAAFLIVDEDRNFRDALTIGLKLDGHVAIGTADADEALLRISSGEFQCCLVDAHLPGADVLLEIAAGAGLRAIATGPYEELLAAAASRHPHAEALPKPFGASELLSRTAAGDTESAA
jgi:DNA-binding NtrC family response regulator